jgi:hypothetical protein
MQTPTAVIKKVPKKKVSLKLNTPNRWKATSGIAVFEKLKQNFMIFSDGK